MPARLTAAQPVRRAGDSNPGRATSGPLSEARREPGRSGPGPRPVCANGLGLPRRAPPTRFLFLGERYLSDLPSPIGEIGDPAPIRSLQSETPLRFALSDRRSFSD